MFINDKENNCKHTIINIILFTIYIGFLGSVTFLVFDLSLNKYENHISALYISGIAISIAIPISLYDFIMHYKHFRYNEMQSYYFTV